MTNLEQRVLRLENMLQAALQQLAQLQQLVGQLGQNQYAVTSPGQGGAGGGANALMCTPSSAIAAGTPGGPLTGQTIYQITGGALASITTVGQVYNPYGAGVVAGKMITVQANSDGTYTAIAQSCT